jgi:ATPase subunit of ABC transporter with duplicated ATPase domains
VAWLESFLRDFKGAVVMVTHDRSLLEALAQWVVDVEHGALAIYEVIKLSLSLSLSQERGSVH